MIYIHLILIVGVLLLSGCSTLDNINREVNGYPYKADTPKESAGPPKRMSASAFGDCEDYAYTKCLLVREAYPDAQLYFLYQSASQNRYNEAHAALRVDNTVLDNTKRRLYAFDAKDWVAQAEWNTCAPINLNKMTNAETMILRPI